MWGAAYGSRSWEREAGQGGNGGHGDAGWHEEWGILSHRRSSSARGGQAHGCEEGRQKANPEDDPMTSLLPSAPTALLSQSQKPPLLEVEAPSTMWGAPAPCRVCPRAWRAPPNPALTPALGPWLSLLTSWETRAQRPQGTCPGASS